MAERGESLAERAAQGMPTRCRECGAPTQARVTDEREQTDMVALAEYVVLGTRCPACESATHGGESWGE